MLDVRNQYEFDVGHFDGALRPQGIDQFSESDAASNPNPNPNPTLTRAITLTMTMTVAGPQGRRHP